MHEITDFVHEMLSVCAPLRVTKRQQASVPKMGRLVWKIGTCFFLNASSLQKCPRKRSRERYAATSVQNLLWIMKTMFFHCFENYFWPIFFKNNFIQNVDFFSSHKFNVFFFLNYYERFTVEIKIRGENVYHIFHSLRRFLTENTMHVCKVPDIPDTYAKKILFFVKNLLNKILNLGLGGQSSPNTKKNESIYFFSEFFYKNRLKRIQKKIIKIRAKKNVAPLS